MKNTTILKKVEMKSVEIQLIAANANADADLVILGENQFFMFPKDYDSFIMKVMRSGKVGLKVADEAPEKITLKDILGDDIELKEGDVLNGDDFEVFDKEDIERWTNYEADLLAMLADLVDRDYVTVERLTEVIEDLSERYSYASTISMLYDLSCAEWCEMESSQSPYSYLKSESSNRYGEESRP